MVALLVVWALQELRVLFYQLGLVVVVVVAVQTLREQVTSVALEPCRAGVVAVEVLGLLLAVLAVLVLMVKLTLLVSHNESSRYC